MSIFLTGLSKPGPIKLKKLRVPRHTKQPVALGHRVVYLYATGCVHPAVFLFLEFVVLRPMIPSVRALAPYGV